MKRFKFHVDPGHGWLEVPMAVIWEFGIQDQITRYSYQSHDGKVAYLEEDCDLTTFAKAWAKVRGLYAEGESHWDKLKEYIEMVYHDQRGAPECFIRSLPDYNGGFAGSFHRRAS